MLRKHPQSTIQELFRPDSTNDKQNIKDVTIIFIGCGESGRHYLYQEPRQHKKTVYFAWMSYVYIRTDFFLITAIIPQFHNPACLTSNNTPVTSDLLPSEVYFF